MVKVKIKSVYIDVKGVMMWVNRFKMASATVKGVLTLLLVSFIGVGTADALSNTSVTTTELQNEFGVDFSNLSLTTDYSNVFEFDIDGGGSDGTVSSWYKDGGTGYYLYFYQIDFLGTSLNPQESNPYRINDISFEFGGLTGYDLTGTPDLETSFYVGDVSGNWPNAGASYLDGVISFDFTCCNTLDPGEKSTYFGAVSTNAWVENVATITNITGTSGETSTTTMVVAPVPEPSTLLLLGTGLLGFGILLRRRNKESQLGL